MTSFPVFDLHFLLWYILYIPATRNSVASIRDLYCCYRKVFACLPFLRKPRNSQVCQVCRGKEFFCCLPADFLKWIAEIPVPCRRAVIDVR